MVRHLLALLLLACALPSGAAARVERFAVVIGNNLGHPADSALSYAESDAARMLDVLRAIGGFTPVNTVLLTGEDERTVRSTLIAVNDRIRSHEEAGVETVLFVYYSGHADRDALHLGSTSLDLQELGQLVRGSAATFRLLIVDACRSGSLTRVKGGRSVPPFDLPLRSKLSGKGLAFLTASSENEDAQESEELRGSFFTSALVSGLLGAADRNHDGLVSMEEVYRHAYDATVRETSRTPHGVQHPTFHYDLRGQDGLVLTDLRTTAHDRAALSLPAQLGFLVMRGDRDGPVIAEVPSYAASRTLSLSPGRYFVRGRGAEFLLEGSVVLEPAEARRVEVRALERVQYARYVRKGNHDGARAHAMELGSFIHSQLPGASGPCLGGTAGYTLDLEHLSLAARTGLCRSQLETVRIDASTTAYELGLTAAHPWHVSRVGLALGLGGGVLINHQDFDTRGSAPSRTSSEPFAVVLGMVSYDLGGRLFVRLEARAVTHFMRVRNSGSSNTQLEVVLAGRGALLLGIYLGS